MKYNSQNSPKKVVDFLKDFPDEELVVPGMEPDGGDEVDVLEHAEALLTRDVPQPYSLKEQVSIIFVVVEI